MATPKHGDLEFVIAGVVEPAYDVGGACSTTRWTLTPPGSASSTRWATACTRACCRFAAVSAYRNSRRSEGGLVPSGTAADAAVTEAFGPDKFVNAVLGELQLST